MTNLQIAEKIELALNMLRTGKRISANDVLTDVISELKKGETEITPNCRIAVHHTDKRNETKAIILELFRDDNLRVGTCERCGGAGWVVKRYSADCPFCHGTGFEVREGHNHD